MRIEVVVFDGFDELDAIGPLEVLRNVGVGRPEVEVALVGAAGDGGVRAAHGVRIEVDGALGAEAPDLLVVPGGGWAERSERGVYGEVERGELPRRIAAAHAGGATVAGVCTGAMLIGAAGLLEGRPATTIAKGHEGLAAYGARVLAERVVDDGDVLTCGGVTAGLDLAFWLVEREFGTSYARAIAAGMEYERRGSVYIGSRAGAAGRQ